MMSPLPTQLPSGPIGICPDWNTTFPVRMASAGCQVRSQSHLGSIIMMWSGIWQPILSRRSTRSAIPKAQRHAIGCRHTGKATHRIEVLIGVSHIIPVEDVFAENRYPPAPIRTFDPGTQI